MKTFVLATCLAAGMFAFPALAGACTGITLTSRDGATVAARTIEWAGSDLNSRYIVVPHGYEQRSLVPDGTDGMLFTARYGYVGIAVEAEQFIAEGLNEAGLSAGLFYFPNYGAYEAYDPDQKKTTIADLQLVPWILGSCATIDEVKEAVKEVHVVNVDPRGSTAHWRFMDATGRQVVLEIVDRQVKFYENPLGVLTNAPGFEWQLTNLNNYLNLLPGTVRARSLGNIRLASFGSGSAALGLPGDITPPSRFVRAAFYQTTAPQQPRALDTVMQCFHLLNNFDLPLGIEFAEGETVPEGLPSATQWTSASDVTNRVFYFRTMYDSTVRCLDLKAIDFHHVGYRCVPVDQEKQQRAVPVILAD